jgi:hypothetical protein
MDSLSLLFFSFAACPEEHRHDPLFGLRTLHLRHLNCIQISKCELLVYLLVKSDMANMFRSGGSRYRRRGSDGWTDWGHVRKLGFELLVSKSSSAVQGGQQDTNDMSSRRSKYQLYPEFTSRGTRQDNSSSPSKTWTKYPGFPSSSADIETTVDSRLWQPSFIATVF